MAAESRSRKGRDRLVRMTALHAQLGEREARVQFLDWTEDRVGALRSVVDYLLQEYNEEYGLGIDLNARLTFDKFERTAQSSGNSKAMAFVAWLRKEFQSLGQDKILGPLLNQRHLTIHRKEQEMVANVGVEETVRVVDALSITVVRQDGGEEVGSQEPLLPPPQESDTEVTVFWSFSGIPGLDVLEACRQLYDRMAKLVQDSHKLYT